MKSLIYIAAFAVFTLYSCGSSTGKANDNSKSEKTVISTVADNQANAPTGGAVHLTKDMFLKNVWDYTSSPQEWIFKGDKPAIIDFYADWCGPCKIASPILEEISNEYAGKIVVYKIDTEKERELASVFGIQSIPAFLYIPAKGKPVMMAGIGRTKEETKNMFIENIGKYLIISK